MMENELSSKRANNLNRGNAIRARHLLNVKLNGGNVSTLSYRAVCTGRLLRATHILFS